MTRAVIVVREVAVVRTGDKGDLINVAVIPYRESDYSLLLRYLTEERVAQAFSHLNPRSVRRYQVDGFHALNFVVVGVLDGGVSRSRSLDGHGKALSGLVACLELPARTDAQHSSKTRTPPKENR